MPRNRYTALFSARERDTTRMENRLRKPPSHQSRRGMKNAQSSAIGRRGHRKSTQTAATWSRIVFPLSKRGETRGTRPPSKASAHSAWAVPICPALINLSLILFFNKESRSFSQLQHRSREEYNFFTLPFFRSNNLIYKSSRHSFRRRHLFPENMQFKLLALSAFAAAASAQSSSTVVASTTTTGGLNSYVSPSLITNNFS